jgi:integrase
MSFVDIAYLKQGDIRNGILTYKRRKTGQMLNIRWEEAMQEIVDRYQKQHGGTYLLPIINKENGKERNQYRHVQTQVNKHLKTIAEMAGMSTKLTMYCARHSWATIARQLQIPMEVISHGMGHTHERTTEIYLKSIDIESIDQANRRIISLLQQDEQE